MSNSLTNQAPTRQTWLKWGVVTLFIVWLFYVLTAYYVVNKPLDLPLVNAFLQEPETWLRLDFSAAALGRTILDLLAAAWLTFIALGVGLRLLRWIQTLPLPDLETTIYSLGLGFGALGLMTLLLGLVGLLSTRTFYIIDLLLTLLTATSTASFIRGLRLPPRSRIISIYLFLTIGLALTIALLPPTSWDGLFYHLKGPALYLENGKIAPGIDIPHLNFPSLFEMLYTMAIAVRGDVTAKLLHFVFSFMLAGLVYAAARDHLRVMNSWSAVIFLYAMPMLVALSGWAYNDLALAFYQVAALVILSYWQNEQNRRWLTLSGILCGLAMGLKYTSFVAPLVLAWIVIWKYRGRLANAIQPLFHLVIPAAVVAAPWYLKNLVFTGNPIYPFVFDGRFWDEFRSAAYAGTGTGLGLDPVALLRLPHDLTLGLHDASRDGPTGPFFLIFLPLILIYASTRLRKSAPTLFRSILLFALAQYLFWMFGVIFSAGLWQSRLLLPAFVALSPLLAWIWQDLKRLDHPQFSLQRFINLTLGLALLLALVNQVSLWLPQAPLAYLIGTDSREEVLTRQLGLHYVVMDEMKFLPPDAVITFLWEPRSYYCRRDCRPDSILDTFSHLEHLYGSAGSIAEHWRQEKINYVLIHEAGLDFVVAAETEWVAPRDMSTLDDLRRDYLTLVKEWDNAYTLYRLTP